jgi:hypothetical protein
LEGMLAFVFVSKVVLNCVGRAWAAAYS